MQVKWRRNGNKTVKRGNENEGTRKGKLKTLKKEKRRIWERWSEAGVGWIILISLVKQAAAL